MVRYLSHLDTSVKKGYRIITSQCWIYIYATFFYQFLKLVIWLRVISYYTSVQLSQVTVPANASLPLCSIKSATVCRSSPLTRKYSALSTANHNHFQTHRVNLKWQIKSLFSLISLFYSLFFYFLAYSVSLLVVKANQTHWP